MLCYLYENADLSTDCVARSSSIDRRWTCRMGIDPLKTKWKCEKAKNISLNSIDRERGGPAMNMYSSIHSCSFMWHGKCSMSREIVEKRKMNHCVCRSCSVVIHGQCLAIRYAQLIEERNSPYYRNVHCVSREVGV